MKVGFRYTFYLDAKTFLIVAFGIKLPDYLFFYLGYFPFQPSSIPALMSV